MKKIIVTYSLITVIAVAACLTGCKSKRCIVSDCSENRISESDYCSRHKCSVFNCRNRAKNGSDYCEKCLDEARINLEEAAEKAEKDAELYSQIYYEITATKNKKDVLNICKETIESKLKIMGYDNAKINIKGDFIIDVRLPKQENIEDLAETLISGSDLEFTDYNGNVLLNGNDIKEINTKYDKNNNSYYLLLKFTKEGQSKFKQATAKIAQLPNSDNYICIVIDNSVISAPTVTQEIDSDSCIITGDFSKDSAKTLENQINFTIHKNFIKVMSAE